MSSTYSILKFELPGNGEQSGTWGTTTNTNIGTAIEQAIVGMATLSSGDFTANVATLTLANTNAAQNARALCLNIASGAVSAAGTVNVPAIEKPYIVINGSSFTVTVKVSGQTGVAVPAGKRTVVYNNGTDVGSQIDWLAALDLAGNASIGGTLGVTGAVTLSGGTANGVAYLNGSKVLTTGGALTFDGTRLTVGTATAAGALTVVAPVSTAYGAFDAPTAGFAFTDYKYNGTRYGLLGQAGALFSGASHTDFGVLASSSLLFGASGSEQMRLTSTGLGIGTSSTVGRLTLRGAAGTSGKNQGILLEYSNGTEYGALGLNNGSGWPQLMARAGAGITFHVNSDLVTTGEAMRLDSSGYLGLGVTPSAWGSSYKALQIGARGSLYAHATVGSTALGENVYDDGTRKYIATAPAGNYEISAGVHYWRTAPSGTAGNAISFTQAMTLDASGNLLVGITSDDHHVIAKNTGNGTGTTSIFQVQNAGSDAVAIFLSGTSYGTSNSAGTSLRIGRSSSTSRSINAGGTINASGADYAEYMTKAGDFAVAKGDVVGINADGKLTNVFADAVSFVVKSTDPSYVGGDVWGNEESIGKRPAKDATDAEKAAYADALEAARQKVDRIAFAGQVPVNVMGATPGQYIVPVNESGSIKGIAKNEADMTLAEYMKAVGKVISVQDDGRAFIIVKVA